MKCFKCNKEMEDYWDVDAQAVAVHCENCNLTMFLRYPSKEYIDLNPDKKLIKTINGFVIVSD